MQNFIPGFKNWLGLIVIGILVVGGLFYITIQRDSELKNSLNPEAKLEDQDEQMMEKKTEDVMEDKNKMTGQEEGDRTTSGDSMMVKYEGTILGGTTSPILDFRQSDYEAALKTDKLIVLYFYANWCPICRAEFPVAESAFGSLSGDDVIGFRVNFNDNETDDAEVSLARQFGVAYQHTKVFVKNGQRVLKSPETWDKDRYLSEIAKY
jgi:thiol-disulfide isomerase/thioredoxin